MLKRIAVLLTLVLASVAPGQQRDARDTSRTIYETTRPYYRLNLPFYSAGIVSEWKVKPGQLVKKGDVLITQDARIEETRLMGLKLLAESNKRIEAAQAQLELEKVLLERKKAASNDPDLLAFSESEILEQQVKVDIGEKNVALEEEKKREAEFEAEAQRLRVELMELRSPIDGRVVQFHVGPGEMADPQKPEGVVTVVQNNPLYITFQLPTEQAQALKVGDTMNVAYTSGGEPTAAAVVFIDPEALSDTQTVRLEWPNPDNHDSGLPVVIELPERIIAASAK